MQELTQTEDLTLMKALEEAEQRAEAAELSSREGHEETQHALEGQIQSLQSQLRDERKHTQALEDRQSELRRQIEENEVSLQECFNC